MLVLGWRQRQNRFGVLFGRVQTDGRHDGIRTRHGPEFFCQADTLTAQSDFKFSPFLSELRQRKPGAPHLRAHHRDAGIAVVGNFQCLQNVRQCWVPDLGPGGSQLFQRGIAIQAAAVPDNEAVGVKFERNRCTLCIHRVIPMHQSVQDHFPDGAQRIGAVFRQRWCFPKTSLRRAVLFDEINRIFENIRHCTRDAFPICKLFHGIFFRFLIRCCGQAQLWEIGLRIV